MALSDDQRQEVENLAELGVRRYFDHYLEHILPKQFELHNCDCRAHGGIVKRVIKWKWLLIGLAVGSGAGGSLLIRLLVGL